MRKKLLVCGATGFLGRNVLEYFASTKTYEIYATYNRKLPFSKNLCNWVACDLRDPKQLETVLKGIDIVIQMAANTSGARDIVNSPHIHISDNAVMNSLLFRMAFEYQIEHVIFPSCSIMYHSSRKPLKETDFDPKRPLYENYFPGAWTKVYLEKMAEFYAKKGKTKFTILRHSNVYGPHDKFDLERSHVFGATVTKVMNQKAGEIVVWGEGKAERDLIHVSDLIHYIELALKKQRTAFELHNVGAGQAISIAELVRKMIKASGKNLKLKYDKTQPTIDTYLSLDCSLAWKKFGWKPKVSIDEGIARTLDWYQQHVLPHVSIIHQNRRWELSS